MRIFRNRQMLNGKMAKTLVRNSSLNEILLLTEGMRAFKNLLYVGLGLAIGYLAGIIHGEYRKWQYFTGDTLLHTTIYAAVSENPLKARSMLAEYLYQKMYERDEASRHIWRHCGYWLATNNSQYEEQAIKEARNLLAKDPAFSGTKIP